MRESPKDQLESELRGLICKYSALMRAGPIAESVIGTMTCIVCAASVRAGELEHVEDDLCGIVASNVHRSMKYILENQKSIKKLLREEK